jgi:hypothetical protein
VHWWLQSLCREVEMVSSEKLTLSTCQNPDISRDCSPFFSLARLGGKRAFVGMLTPIGEICLLETAADEVFDQDRENQPQVTL